MQKGNKNGKDFVPLFGGCIMLSSEPEKGEMTLLKIWMFLNLLK